MSVEPRPVEELEPERLTGPREALRVATQRNFGPYFLGNALSASGTWFQNLAASLLVFRLTHSPFLLGVLNFAQFIPVRTGIASETEIEVFGDAKEGESVVAGPYKALRELKPNTKVKQEAVGSRGRKT